MTRRAKLAGASLLAGLTMPDRLKGWNQTKTESTRGVNLDDKKSRSGQQLFCSTDRQILADRYYGYLCFDRWRMMNDTVKHNGMDQPFLISRKLRLRVGVATTSTESYFLLEVWKQLKNSNSKQASSKQASKSRKLFNNVDVKCGFRFGTSNGIYRLNTLCAICYKNSNYAFIVFLFLCFNDKLNQL